MEDQAQDLCNSDGNPGFPERPPRKRVWLWTTVAIVVLLVLAFFLGVPYLARRGQTMGSGSCKYARQWKTQLLACQSLDDVKQHFNCIEWVPMGPGSATMVKVTGVVAGRPDALIKSFPDGKWIACAFASSHSEPGGGTVVTRDSDGKVHIFFGHVCGEPFAEGNTVEDYADLKRHNHLEEQPPGNFD